MLVGRDGEIKLIGDVLQRAREGSAAVLRISGGPGIGKTALLDITQEQATASGMSVVRLTAVESESAIPSSALALLLNRMGHRPAMSGSPVDLLEALSHASRQGPLAVLVDDIQWLDDRSMAALAFACRRLLADPIAVVLACQPSSAVDSPFGAFPLITLEPLTIEQSVQLLGDSAPELPVHLADEVARELAGVPLALVGVRDLLTPDELAGSVPLPSPVPVDRAVQVRYASGWGAMDDRSRRAVTLLAVDDTAEPTVIVAGLGKLGLGIGELLPAELHGLVRLDRIPRFAHPLARAAVHGAAPRNRSGRPMRPWGRSCASATMSAGCATGRWDRPGRTRRSPLTWSRPPPAWPPSPPPGQACWPSSAQICPPTRQGANAGSCRRPRRAPTRRARCAWPPRCSSARPTRTCAHGPPSWWPTACTAPIPPA